MPHTPSRRKTLRGIGMRLSRGWPFEAEAVERLGISCSLCAFPLQSGEILRAVKLCHLCDLSERFGEGDMCDTSVAVVWLKMVSCETGPSAYKFHKRKKKKVLTSKLDASLDSPGNHKITFLKTAKYAISTPLSSFKETRVAGKG